MPIACDACRRFTARSRGALRFASDAVEIESGSATDNPLVFPEPGDVLSGGNFHGAPLALAFDCRRHRADDLASIAERRIDRLVNPDLNEGLPAFLAARPGGLQRLHDRARRGRLAAERMQGACAPGQRG